MKKWVKILGLLCLTTLMSSTALASSSVTYQGGAEKFVFLPGSEYEETDLFQNFKNVLPGDIIEQRITVQNSSNKSVRIYMRAEPVTEGDRDFLEQLQLQVVAADKTIFEAAASEQAGLKQNVLLGSFKKKGRTELVVTLTVPTDMGNEYMGVKGTVPWTFLVEEIDTGDGSPKTGDDFQATPWIITCAAGCGLAILLIILRRRRRAE